jgi:hypothetical protein
MRVSSLNYSSPSRPTRASQSDRFLYLFSWRSRGRHAQFMAATQKEREISLEPTQTVPMLHEGPVLISLLHWQPWPLSGTNDHRIRQVSGNQPVFHAELRHAVAAATARVEFACRIIRKCPGQQAHEQTSTNAMVTTGRAARASDE